MTSDQSEVAFNLQGRLKTVSGASGTSEYTYDDSGIRVSQAVTASGSTTTTLYFVDDNNPTGYAQVLEEKSSTGTPAAATLPTRTYTLGHDVIAQVDGASAPVRVLLKDGHDSTRQLRGSHECSTPT
jgi:YD repeat-containing protein